MKKLLLAIFLFMALFVGCSSEKETQENTEQTGEVATGVNQEYIDEFKEVIENTMQYESLKASITVVSQDGTPDTISNVLISKNPNMGIITSSFNGELSSASIYIDKEDMQVIASLSPTITEDGEFEMDIIESEYNHFRTRDEEFSDASLNLKNLIAIFEDANNIKSIEKTQNGFEYELSQSYFDNLLKIQTEGATEQLEGIPEEARASFEVMIALNASQENQSTKVVATVEDGLMVKQEADAKMDMATLNLDGTLSEEKQEVRTVTVFEIISFNDNENIQNEILDFYEENK